LSAAEIERLLVRLAQCLDIGEDRLQVFALRDSSPPKSLGQTAEMGKTWVV
jgi:hypothetical protein